MHSIEVILAGQNDRYYDKVYMRRGHRCDPREASASQVTNPSISSSDDQTVDEIEHNISSDSVTGIGGVYISGKPGTPYPVERYVFYLKISKNYKCFTSSSR